MSPRERSRLYSAALLAPVDRVLDSVFWVRVWAAVLVVAQWIWGLDLFVLLWFVLLATAAWDYRVGSRRAEIEDRHDEDISRAKLLGKVNGLVVPWLLRATEMLALKAGADTGGAAAAAVTALLLFDELRSLNRHNVALTGREIPLLGALLDAMTGNVSRLIPGGTPAPAPSPPPAPEPEP